jgi:hypothetical protein
VAVFDDRIEVENPGILPFDYTSQPRRLSKGSPASLAGIPPHREFPSTPGPRPA